MFTSLYLILLLKIIRKYHSIDMSYFRINCFQYVNQSDERELTKYIRINERLLINMVIFMCVTIRKKQLIQLKIDENIQFFLFI